MHSRKNILENICKIFQMNILFFLEIILHNFTHCATFVSREIPSPFQWYI